MKSLVGWRSFGLMLMTGGVGIASAREFIGLPGAKYGEETLRPFAIQRNDVTVAQYRQCVRAGVCADAPLTREEGPQRCNGINGRSRHPINCVTWDEAAHYCHWRHAELPSGAQWEYAANGGDNTRTYPWGDAPITAERANYCDKNCASALGEDGKNLAQWRARGWIAMAADDAWATTAPVGSFAKGASPFGVLDMAGNVWQWTTDSAKSGERDVRGGSWDNAPVSLPIKHRLSWPQTAADSGMGFRCVRGG